MGMKVYGWGNADNICEPFPEQRGIQPNFLGESGTERRAFRGMPWGIQGGFVAHSMGIRLPKWGIQLFLHLARVENFEMFTNFL